MARRSGKYKKVDFSADIVQGEVSSGYSPMRARNFCTGELQEVILMTPGAIAHLATFESHPELRADLNTAFEQFNATQRRILFRVLVQGQSLRVATNGMRKSTQFWHHWYKTVAIPGLRKALADYKENRKLVLQ